MDQLTLGAIGIALATLVAFITNIKKLKSEIDNILKNALKPTNDKIDELEVSLKNELKKSDMNATKNFLVARISDIKKGRVPDDITLERFWEQFEHYKNMGGNSYIQNEVDKLKKEGKI